MATQLRPDLAINLLIIEHSLNDAELYASTLRNAGIPTHPTRVDDEDQLTEKLEQNSDFDMVFYADQSAGVPLSQAVALCRKRLPDIPFLIIAKQAPSAELINEALKRGVRDVLSKEHREHIQLAAAREFGDLQMRRELAQLKSKLTETESRATSLVEKSRDAIAYVHEGMYINANQAYLEMFGYESMEDLEGMPIMDMVAPNDHKKFKEFLRSLKQDKTTKLSVQCRNSNGEIFDSELEFSPASIEGEPCTQIIIHDQSNTKELEQKLKELSNIDSYTGLPNRAFFMEKIEELLAKPEKERKPHTIFYILVDNLQEIRSKSGITAGDALLKELGEMFNSVIGSGDLLARFGEHTFTILSPRAEKKDAEALGEKIRSTIEDHLYQSIGQVYQPTCSIGINLLTQKTANSQTLINQCYNACSSAHDAGGNRVLSYDATSLLSEKGEAAESQIQELIRYALEQDRFKLVYQPMVSLQGDSRENYAVMIRLLDRNNEEIFPDQFLARSADQDDLMTAVDRWVIDHAAKELVKQRKGDRKLIFYITISAAGIRDANLLLWICDCLRDSGVKGGWLSFQLHEEDVRAHTQEAKRLMEGLRKIGATVTLDHFGTLPKYETLLKHLPIDFIKTDRSFVQGLAGSQEKQDALNELSQKIHEFNMKVIAMGIEDANTLAVLWTMGVDYIQGFYLQEPSAEINFDFASF